MQSIVSFCATDVFNRMELLVDYINLVTMSAFHFSNPLVQVLLN
uniref:Uncharacterized protein n=1 Tax=Arundo donax TaxID=35708 RepID=A0A0A9Q029_ARUDO